MQLGVIIPCVGTALLILANTSNSITNRLLGTRLPSYIGKISYSLYLYHWPAIIFWKVFSGKQDLGFQDSLVIIIVVVALSILSYLFVEQPARKSKLSDWCVLSFSLVVIVGFSVSFSMLEDLEVAPWRITRYSEQIPKNQSGEQDCKEIKKDNAILFECQSTVQSETPIVALIGDSHAPHFLVAAKEWARNNGHNVKLIAAAGCPMLLGEIHVQSRKFPVHEVKCEETLPQLKSQIIEDPRVDFVLIGQRFDLFYDGKGYSTTLRDITFTDPQGGIIKDYESYYQEQLSYTVNAFKEAGKEVVILKQVPIFSNIEDCNWESGIKKLFSKERFCEFDPGFIHKWQKPSIDFVDSFAAEHQLEVFDPMVFIDTPLQGGTNIYKNKDHLNHYGFRFLVPFFEKALFDMVLRKHQDNLPSPPNNN